MFSFHGRYAFALGCAAALLAGCADRNLAGAPAFGQTFAGRISPRAASQKLLYVSDKASGQVRVYTYPALENVGTLTGFGQPAGECVDAAGDVWITDDENQQVVEYAHGGSSPIAILKDPGYQPDGCSVDPTSGDLAVAAPLSAIGREGHLAIFTNARGTPKTYTIKNIYYYYFCSYDDAGDLFVDGSGRAGVSHVAELPAGGATLENIALNHKVPAISGVLWHGTSLAIENGHVPTSIDRFAIDGGTARFTGKTKVTGAKNLLQFSIQGSTLIAPDADEGSVFFYQYPAGGSPFATITGLGIPRGTAVSAP